MARETAASRTAPAERPGGDPNHDYKRHGTTTLFAALNLADGKVIGTCQKRHRHQEWLRFLQLMDANTPPEKTLHRIVDNY